MDTTFIANLSAPCASFACWQQVLPEADGGAK